MAATTAAAGLAPGLAAPEQVINSRLASLDLERLRRELAEQGAFLYVEDFLPREIMAQLVAAIAAVQPAINRNYLPGHKQGGSVGPHPIIRFAPSIPGQYPSPRLIHGLGRCRALNCRSRRITIRMPMRSISIPARATISDGTTTTLITPAVATHCCSASSTSRPAGWTINCIPANRAPRSCRAR